MGTLRYFSIQQCCYKREKEQNNKKMKAGALFVGDHASCLLTEENTDWEMELCIAPKMSLFFQNLVSQCFVCL